jgi:hypothetical protein
MAYDYHDDSEYHPTLFDPHHFDPYSFPDQISGYQEFNVQTKVIEVLAYDWDMMARPELMAGSSADACATVNYGKYHRNFFGDRPLMFETTEQLAEATWDAVRSESWPKQSDAQIYHPERTDQSRQGTFFAGAVTQESSTTIPDPCSCEYLSTSRL